MPDRRLVLIETSAALPGLLPPQAYQSLGAVDRILARDPASHPSVPALEGAGFTVEAAEPASAESALRGMNLLTATGEAAAVRLARGVVAACADADVAYLQGPGDDGFARTLGIEASRAGGIEVEFVFLVGAPLGLELLRLVEVMAALRDPETGCPWDLQQDHRTLSRHLLEEAYELLEAIESDDDRHIAEELGDVLLQVVFHAQVAADRGAFGIDEVAEGIADKLVRRHPHVFGDGDATTPEEVQANWDELKQQEKPHRTGPFDGVPTALPALMLADELQRKAGKHGFAWGGPDEVVAKVREELAEVLDADAADVGDEVGDLLQVVVSLARVLDVDAEAALRSATGRFRSRFERMLSRLQAAGRDPGTLQPAEWLALWDEVKAAGW